MHHEQQMCALLGLRAFCRTPAPLARRRPVPAARSRVLCVAFLAGERAQSSGRTRVTSATLVPWPEARRWPVGSPSGALEYPGAVHDSLWVLSGCARGTCLPLGQTACAGRGAGDRVRTTRGRCSADHHVRLVAWNACDALHHGRVGHDGSCHARAELLRTGPVGRPLPPGAPLFFRRGVRMTASTVSASCDARACSASYIRPAHATWLLC